jgi:hypothetical protein
MAAKEVIYFPFGTQHSTRPQFPASLFSPEPVANSPPEVKEPDPDLVGSDIQR